MTPRPRLAFARSLAQTFLALGAALRSQRLGSVSLFAYVIFFLALLFGFLAFVPILSPFVYPLF